MRRWLSSLGDGVRGDGSHAGPLREHRARRVLRGSQLEGESLGRRSLALLLVLAVMGCGASQPAAPATRVVPGTPAGAGGGEPATSVDGTTATESSPSLPSFRAGAPGAPSNAPAAAAGGGACFRLGQEGAGRRPLPLRATSECAGGSQAVERDVATRLAREAKDGDARKVVQVDYPCVTLRDAPGPVRAVVVDGHGGYARVVGLRSTGAGTFRARVLRVATGGGPNQTPPGPVEFFRTELTETAVVGTFDRMRIALAARVTLDRPPLVKGDRIELGSVGTSSIGLSIELALEDSLGGTAARAWQGNRGTLEAENRLPVEFAWRALSELGIEKTPFRAAQPDDRALLRDAWLPAVPGFERPWYTTRALLLLAAAAGSAELIPSIVDLLASDDEEIQRLATDALAAISGRDMRRDASGNPRELGAIVADYRRECGPP